MLPAAFALYVTLESASLSHADQILGGPAFQAFAGRAGRLCPDKHLRSITPGDLSGLQETFYATLTPGQKARLDTANHQDKQCAGRDGLSCPVSETLKAMKRTRLLPSFVAFACGQ